MTRPLLICTAYSSDELRHAARYEEDRPLPTVISVFRCP